MAMPVSLDSMALDYEVWCANRDYSPMSADELLADICATPPERRTTFQREDIAYLKDFIARWNAMEACAIFDNLGA